MIRDKQPPEVIEESRRKKAEAEPGDFVEMNDGADAELLSVFVRDAEKALTVFSAALLNVDTISSDDLRLYTTNAHAMKSALANIGEKNGAELAAVLETAGKNGDSVIIKTQTQNLIEALKAVIARNEEISSTTAKTYSLATDENTGYLSEQLDIIRFACAEYDDIAAKAALYKLKKQIWNKETTEALSKIDELLLHSDFENAEAVAAEQVKALLGSVHGIHS